MEQIMKSFLCESVSVCLSQSHFLIDFHKKWHGGKKRKVRTRSLAHNIGPPFPYNGPKMSQKGRDGHCALQSNHQRRKIAMSRSHQTGSLRRWHGRYNPSRGLPAGWFKLV